MGISKNIFYPMRQESTQPNEMGACVCERQSIGQKISVFRGDLIFIRNKSNHFVPNSNICQLFKLPALPDTVSETIKVQVPFGSSSLKALIDASGA